MASGSDFSLVGINQAWNTVVLGDKIRESAVEAPSAKNIRADVGTQKRNIFQDIFGVSAFQNFSLQPISALQEQPIDLPKSSDPLDTPAYLLPPLQTLFTPLVERLLQKRSAPPPLEAREEQEQVEDEDVVMADPMPPNPGSSRPLEQGEMDMFVELFMQETFSPKQGIPATPRTTAHTNGNGIAKVVNGTHRHKSTSSAAQARTSINGKSHPPESPAEQGVHMQDSSPAVIGKKRKKSMG